MHLDTCIKLKTFSNATDIAWPSISTSHSNSSFQFINTIRQSLFMALLYNQTNLSGQDLLNSIALSDTLSSNQKLNYRKHSKANFRIRIHSTLSRLKNFSAQNLIMQIEMFPTRPQIKFMAISVFFAERIRRDNFGKLIKSIFCTST